MGQSPDSNQPPVAYDDITPTRALAIKGGLWAITGAALRDVITGLTMLVLTRVLVPNDFGLVTITLVAQELITHVAPVGFQDALIQRSRLESADLDSAFWSILALSGVLAILVIALSPLIAAWFDQPILTALLIGITLASLVRAASTVPRALLNRRMDFRTLALARVTGLIGGSVCAITLALAGAGPWSLVARFAVLNGIAALVVWRVTGWRPGRQITRPALRHLWSFAPSVSIFVVLAYVIGHSDDQLIGYRLGPEALGYYAVAYGLMAWPVRDILGGMAGVIYPVFARIQDDPPRFQAAYLESLQLAALFAFPTLALIVITAPVLVPWLLGARWNPAVLTVQILAIGGLRESTAMLNGPVYRASGKPHLHTLFQVCGAACYLVAFWVGLDFGIEGVAFFYILTGALLQPVSWWLVLGVLHLSFWRWLRALLPVMLATALMTASSVIMLWVTRESWNLDRFTARLLAGAAGGTVYGVTIGFLTPALLRQLLKSACPKRYGGIVETQG
ncbi:MAG: lipopolysaccharide biosynthesis protein [Anaerolineae bacterium]|nr:lipopolysaccharide biosynthesis protein [Anaerolineae bacterium]